MHYKIGNSKFLDKILNQYENVQGSTAAYRMQPSLMEQTIVQQSCMRSQSLKQKGTRKKKKKAVSKSRSNEGRECAFLNDATLDTFEVKKIDEAMAKMSASPVQVSPKGQLQTRESKKSAVAAEATGPATNAGAAGSPELNQMSKTTLKSKKRAPHFIIMRGKKYRVFKDNYLV